MVNIEPTKDKKGVCIKLNSETDHDVAEEIKSAFRGRHNLLTLAGYIVGGILIGRSLWSYLSNELGLLLTIVIGIVILTLSAAHAGRFFQ